MDFAMEPNAKIEFCRGFASVKKEAGRPGSVRISHQRTVRFTPELDQYRLSRLRYWLQAEMACVAFEPYTPPAAKTKSAPARVARATGRAQRRKARP